MKYHLLTMKSISTTLFTKLMDVKYIVLCIPTQIDKTNFFFVQFYKQMPLITNVLSLYTSKLIITQRTFYM